MSLFQKTIINKYLKIQNQETINQKWDLFCKHFHNAEIQENIRNSKEEEYQEGFLRDLFVNVLGYTLKPQINHNLYRELKNVNDSKKADGGIIVNEVVTAVIELKGTDTTDLGKVESQAFGYKNNQSGCKYVITSNFEKLRFYIDNAIEYLEFNLFELTKDDFEILYLCLSFENISADIPAKIKNESVSKEDEITKKLYKDYSVFKRELFNNLIKQNSEFDQLELFKKSQKLLDRLLFLFFGEDRGLLPPNSVRLILEQWNKLKDLDEYVPLYDRFKKYFGYLNTGFKGKQFDVFAYNGGLFKPDEILDNITIDDTLLYNHTYKLAEYDFASEVDVNILGHIFENSLNEIDEIKAQLEGQEIDKSKTKRKKDGVFYTPKYITKYIVENTVSKLCEEKKVELGIVEEDYFTDKKRQQKTKLALLQKLDDYRTWLHQITIIDPACGSGAFLNEALNFLIEEHKYIDELEAKLTGSSIAFTYHSESILENNLFGVDLNEESVEIAKLSLWLRTAEPNRKLNDLSNNIKCGNSLIDDPEIAGEKAFNWEKEFPQIFAKGGFDVVIGNPPYVRQELIKHFAKFFEKNFMSYNGKADLFVYFYEKAYQIVKGNGIVSFISSGKFFEASYGKKIIKFLVENSTLIEVIDFKDLNIFEGISAYPLILSFQKTKKEKYYFKYENASEIKVEKLSDIIQHLSFDLISIDDFIANNYSFIDEKIASLIKKMNNNSVVLSELNLLPLVGVKTGFNEGYMNKASSYSRNYVFGRDIKKYGAISVKNTLFFPYEFKDEKYQLIEEDNNELNALIEDKFNLEKRAVIREGLINDTKKWYEFQQINKLLDFDNEYIVYPNVSLGNNFTLSKGNIVDMTGFIIPSNSKYLLSILNSKLIAFLMEIYAISRRGGYLEYKVQYLSKIPIKNISQVAQQPFIEKADEMLSFNKELQEISEKFQRNLQREFSLETFSKKLQNWYELSFADFLKELAKAKVNLTLSQKAEWEDYFLQEQKKALDCQSKVHTIDKEIDQMVYELYGLTEEEIEIVERN